MGEYETNALRGELSATQTSLYNLQGAVELLKHALDQLPSDIAAAITQGIADAMPAMYPPTISPAEAAELMADAAPGAPAPAPAPAFADEEIAERTSARRLRRRRRKRPQRRSRRSPTSSRRSSTSSRTSSTKFALRRSPEK